MIVRKACLVLAGAALIALATAGFTSAGAQTGPKYKPAFASMLGANEVSADGKKNAGDPDGEGSFAISAGGTSLCYAYTVKALDTPVAAHIHKSKPGKSGGIVLPLKPPDSGDPGLQSECLQNQDQALVEDIIEHPAKYYVNVHTQAYPDGAIRGQLQRLPKKI
jgi:hypothetical protein